MTEGHILSVESMGLVDGPGIRTVVFMQGCALRCAFCHNPDSWTIGAGEVITSDSLMAKIRRFRPYFERSGGGVTFSGGEPLLQKAFLLDMLKRCKEEGIHTCIDTAGVGDGDYDELLSLVDLVLYDVKAVDAEGYRSLCGGDIAVTERFAAALTAHRTETIIRQVVVPGISDSDEYMRRLKAYITEKLPYAKGVELLPYHRMGAHKYEKLGIPEQLHGVPAMDPHKTTDFYKKYFTE